MYALAEKLGKDIDEIMDWPEQKVMGWIAYYAAQKKGK